MQVRWYPEAQLEAGEAARFYREKQPGLDLRFLDILDDALNRIRRRPRMYPTIQGDIHKCKPPRFPCGIIYRTTSETIEILAVMHLKREPGYWMPRSG